MSSFHDPFGGFGMMFGLFPIMFFLVFGIIIFSMIRNISVSMKNNKQPIIPVEAKIAAKRYDVSHHSRNHGDNHNHYSSSTRYFVTFEMTNGERMELETPANEFGMMVEGDTGTLEFQGTRFISFTR